jgi:hypothetical protein
MSEHPAIALNRGSKVQRVKGPQRHVEREHVARKLLQPVIAAANLLQAADRDSRRN